MIKEVIFLRIAHWFLDTFLLTGFFYFTLLLHTLHVYDTKPSYQKGCVFYYYNKLEVTKFMSTCLS